jgi:hypothetical protein
MKFAFLKILMPILAGSTTSAFAAAHSFEQGDSGILIWSFIGFGVIVLLFQAAPAMVMFFSMVKGLFSNTITEVPLSAHKGKSDSL